VTECIDFRGGVNGFCHQSSLSGYIDIVAAPYVRDVAFADWLRRQMDLAGFGGNQSKLAAYLGTRPSTVNAWFTRGAVPSVVLCHRLAKVLRVPVDDVLRAAGHPVSEPAETSSSLPSWLPSMLPLLEQLTDSEAMVLAETARGLLRLREERARYEAQQPPAPQPPPAAEPAAPQPGRHRRRR
jgi:DNA-binding XRE family transcriptional regulator